MDGWMDELIDRGMKLEGSGGKRGGGEGQMDKQGQQGIGAGMEEGRRGRRKNEMEQIQEGRTGQVRGIWTCPS